MKRHVCWRLEGRGDDRDFLVGRFSSQKLADTVGNAMHASESHSIGYGPIVEQETIVIHETVEEFDPTLDSEARRSALDKLTDADKRALGLDQA